MLIAQHSSRAAGDPLSRHLLFQTFDASEARERVADIYCPHELTIIGGSNSRVDTRMSHVPLGGASLNRLRYGPTVKIDAGQLKTFVLVMMPLLGAAHVTCGEERMCARPGAAAVVSPTQPFYQTIDANCDQIMVQIDRELVERTCAQHIGHELRQPLQFRLELDMANGCSGWPALVSYLLAEFDGNARYLHSPLVRAPLEHLIAATLLHSQFNNYSEELAQPARPIVPSHVKRVEEYIKAHADEPLTVASLAAYAGVSTSALYAGFRDFRNTSPMAYLRAERLRRVHEELLGAVPATANVTDVAMRWGFQHLSHFAAHYKKKFGELPSDTLRKQ
ncbi:AraC family transcriptional regulator [Denitratisoma sp. DHT3]|uniref:AraC family transcriptional regulator n=1 Tax=Denitratisoma sp. DHT3 TaxID=1981880 RepID=UPI001644D4A0|nr:AraC family transcriptional regulator [Denitratisoma sp. DHT3]